MKNSSDPEILITGIGITSAIGQGKEAFTPALLQGRHNFAVMKRPGRQLPGMGENAAHSPFLGAEIATLSMPESIPESILRTSSLSGQAALATLHEAWHDANLDGLDPARIGLIVGGSNFQQRELVQTHDAYRGRAQFLRPSYGFCFMDSDLCGLCTEAFNIRGFAYTLGGASASGQLAVLQAAHAVQSGQVDACIAIGALMDISYWECRGFRALGAMGSDRYATEPALACRPFDRSRDGFIYGESCGAVVIENSVSAARNAIRPYARIRGWALTMDRNRNPNPSLEGETRVIQKTLELAGLAPAKIDYVNPHGTGSLIGDETELQAIRSCGLEHAPLNATKSIIGHGLSAAGTVEIIATLLQMREGRLHPTRNLENPIDPACNWVRDRAIEHDVGHALSLSMGFGGVNSALCLQNIS